MKFINWLKAIWLSFQIFQNVSRLCFLRDRLSARIEENNLTSEMAQSIKTYQEIVLRALTTHYLDNMIWPLDEAQDLHIRSSILVAVGDYLLYGPDKPTIA